jgi:hypothetical protein
LETVEKVRKGEDVLGGGETMVKEEEMEAKGMGMDEEFEMLEGKADGEGGEEQRRDG